MLKNYLLITFRTLIRQKLHSFINIIGLSIGLASCFLILLYVLDELSYDRFNRDSRNIFRVLREDNQTHEVSALTSSMEAQRLESGFPEVQRTTRLVYSLQIYLRKDREFIEAKHFVFADENLFKVFTIRLIKGDPNTVLQDPQSIVISEEAAAKQFGNANPIGKVVTIKISDTTADLRVTGIMERMPENSHFHADYFASLAVTNRFFDRLGSMQGMGPQLESWGNTNYYTYVQIHEKHTLTELEAKLIDFKKRYVDKWLNFSYRLQPLNEIHLYSAHIKYDVEKQGDIGHIKLFSAIAILILAVACVNFVLLSTARSASRSKEIGVRKVVGATRAHLMKEVLFESTLVSIIALPISMVVVELLLPGFNQLTNKNLEINYLGNWQFEFGALFITLIVGAISGSYSAFYLSVLQPVDALKVNLQTGGRRSLLRSILVITQLTISVSLIIYTSIIFFQMQYLQNKKLGFDKEQVITIPIPETITRYELYKNEILKNSNVVNVSGATHVPPTQNVLSYTYRDPSKGPTFEKKIESVLVDYDYFETLGIQFSQGRSFSRDFPSDVGESIILNETAVRELGIEDPIDKRIEVKGQARTIIGIAKDFHFRSLHKVIEPTFILLEPMNIWQALIKVRPENISETISFLRQKWEELSPATPFKYVFIDDEFNNLYKSEQQIENLVAYSTLLAILVASLGLFGLASFVTEKRTKEIGIRKVLGSSTLNILMLFFKEFLVLTLIANVIAWPVAFQIANSWLHNFAYRIEISVWFFVLSGIVALIMTLCTVGVRVVSAARAKPITALRYE